LEEESFNDARLVLVTSVGLVGFSRPETIVVGIVLALFVVAWAVRRKDMILAIAAQLVLLALAYASPAVIGYLGDRVRNQPLLMGTDAVGDAPVWKIPWVTARRVLYHLPVNLLALAIGNHALGWFASLRIVQLLRNRKVLISEGVAIIFLVVEFLAIGIHREGFVRFEKYGQLMVIPLGYLAIRAMQGKTSSKKKSCQNSFLHSVPCFWGRSCTYGFRIGSK
jgi:hypothetical protein